MLKRRNKKEEEIKREEWNETVKRWKTKKMVKKNGKIVKYVIKKEKDKEEN